MIKRLLYLNGLATLGVVLYHASGWGFTAMVWWAHRYLPVDSPYFGQAGTITYYLLRLIEQGIIYTIPSFLFVSGFFVAVATARGRATVGWSFVGARIRYLVIPYLFWSMVILAGFALQGMSFTPDKIARFLLLGQSDPAFYYVPLLCQLYLLAPLIVFLARRWWLPLLLVTGLIQLGVQALQYPFLLDLEVGRLQPLVDAVPKWFFLSRLFWFTFGVVTGFHLQPMKRLLGRIKWPLLTLVLLLFPLGLLEWEAILHYSGKGWLDPRETLIDNLYAAAFILAFLAFDRGSLPLASRIGELGGKSFGIYLVHSIAMTYAARLIYHALPELLAYQLLFVPLLFLLGLGVPLLLMRIVSYSPARRFYSYQFG